MQEGGSAGPRRRSPAGRPHRNPGPVARRLARLVVRTADGLTSALGADPSAGRERISEAHLRDLVAANTRLDPVERRIIDEVLVARDTMVREVMRPRTEVMFLAAGLTLSQAAHLVRTETHTRYPVVDGTHDDVVGFVHLRDLLIRPEGDGRVTIGELTREVKRIPASKRVLAALTEMRRERHHLAVVVDEYGGTAGIVTLEDLIEEVVGEIHDEYDAEPDPVPGRPTDVDGRLNLADFAERAGFALPPGPYETVGGYVMARLGRLPRVGDEARVPAAPEATDEWMLRVLELDGRRVARVGIRAAEPAPSTVIGVLTVPAAPRARREAEANKAAASAS